MPASLRTERLWLRDWKDEDREPFAVLNADPEVMAHFPAPVIRAESDDLADRIVSGLVSGLGSVGGRGGGWRAFRWGRGPFCTKLRGRVHPSSGGGLACLKDPLSFATSSIA